MGLTSLTAERRYSCFGLYSGEMTSAMDDLELGIEILVIYFFDCFLTSADSESGLDYLPTGNCPLSVALAIILSVLLLIYS
jgi:hypothetical protein